MNINERTRSLFMFVHITKRTKALVRVRSYIKRTNTNELPAEQFTYCSFNVRFVCNPSHYYRIANFKIKHVLFNCQLKLVIYLTST
ncbi:hypothetical protein Hanom_Chr16g01449901 [Helianthus anomalus]